MLDLKELKFMFTFFGYRYDVYGYGSLRVAIDSRTNRIVLSYVV